LGGSFWEDFFGRIFWEDFLGGFFWEEYFGRNYLVEINKELMFLSRFWGNARKKDKKFRSLEVRASLSHLKTGYQNFRILYFRHYNPLLDTNRS
jgi:hypothetical protein